MICATLTIRIVNVCDPARAQGDSDSVSLRARRQDTASILKFIFLFIRASFGRGGFMSPLPTPVPRGTGASLGIQNKNSFIHNQGRRNSPWYHPAYVQHANVTLIAVTGLPVIDYYVSPMKSLFRGTGEFSLLSPLGD